MHSPQNQGWGGTGVKRALDPRPPPHSPSEGCSAPPQGVKEGDRWVPEERRRSAPPRSEWSRACGASAGLCRPLVAPRRALASAPPSRGTRALALHILKLQRHTPLPGAVRAGPHSGRPPTQDVSGRSLQDLTGAGDREWLGIRLDHRPPGILVQVPGSGVCVRACACVYGPCGGGINRQEGKNRQN